MYTLLILIIILILIYWFIYKFTINNNEILHILHIGKTSGRALKQSLYFHDRIKVMDHKIDAEDLNKCNNCKILAVIRDPVDRLLSAIYWFKQGGEYNREQINNSIHKFVKNKSISEILSHPNILNILSFYTNHAFRPTILYIKNNKDIVTPLCYNKLDTEFDTKIKPYCNNNNCILEKKNTSKRLKYEELNEEDKIAVNNFVKKYYSHDLIYYNEHCK
tara:strand:- start:4693 stop:5349 length:657 start_codon:yes stop_codon:yes gene_type:complete